MAIAAVARSNIKAAAPIPLLSLSICNRPFVVNERPRTDSLSGKNTERPCNPHGEGSPPGPYAGAPEGLRFCRQITASTMKWWKLTVWFAIKATKSAVALQSTFIGK